MTNFKVTAINITRQFSNIHEGCDVDELIDIIETALAEAAQQAREEAIEECARKAESYIGLEPLVRDIRALATQRDGGEK